MDVVFKEESYRIMGACFDVAPQQSCSSGPKWLVHPIETVTSEIQHAVASAVSQQFPSTPAELIHPFIKRQGNPLQRCLTNLMMSLCSDAGLHTMPYSLEVRAHFSTCFFQFTESKSVLALSRVGWSILVDSNWS